MAHFGEAGCSDKADVASDDNAKLYFRGLLENLTGLFSTEIAGLSKENKWDLYALATNCI